jgi:phosphomannomutase
VTAADVEAAKRIVSHVRSFLELLADDLRELQVALDQAPGCASELAPRLLDDAESWRY